MREILFRGKRLDNGEWVEGDLLHLPHGVVILANGYANIIPVTIGQYTGLKDKNGKKIFEGDIVQHDFGAKQIGVQYAVLEYDCKYASFMINPLNDWMFCQKDDCEVIGNIHDNPELLQENTLREAAERLMPKETRRADK